MVKQQHFSELCFSIYCMASCSKQQNEIGPCYLSPPKRDRTYRRTRSFLSAFFIRFIKCILAASIIYAACINMFKDII